MIQKLFEVITQGLKKVALSLAVLGFGGLVWSLVLTLPVGVDQQQEPNLSESDAGWGSTAITVLQDNLSQLSPIRLANACGLGASSCFKCHNGKRAGEPTSQPWHQDHARVNNSCVGCHGGNPRLMKEAIAHGGMVGDSLSQPEKFCSTCHSGDEGQTFVSRYLESKGGQK